MKKFIFYLLLFPSLAWAGNADDALIRNHFKQGNTFFDNGHYFKALETYTKVIELDPSHIKAYYNRGLVNQKLGFYDRAINDFTRVIQLKSDYIQAFFERGNAYFDEGSYKKAIEDYSKTLKVIPDDAQSLFNRGLAYKRLKNYKAAYQDFQKLCDSGNDNACTLAKKLSPLLVPEAPLAPKDREKPLSVAKKQPLQPAIHAGNVKGAKQEIPPKIPECSEGMLDLGDGTVKDCKSGLIWMRDLGSSGGIKNWFEAITYVQTLKYPTCGNWRMPTRSELKALSDNLLNCSRNPFLNIKNDFYWTKDEHDPDHAWLVYLFPFSDERINTKKSTLCMVLPVCSGI